MKRIFLVVSCLCFISCSEQEKQSIKSGIATSFEEKKEQVKKKNSPDVGINEVFSPNPDEESFPLEIDVKSYFIEIGSTYHDTDELPQIQRKEKWLGFYKNEDGSTELKETEVNFKRVFDGMFDKPKENVTGIKPVPSNANNCQFVVNPIGGMVAKKLISFIPDNTIFFPGDEVVFSAENIEYRLFATGEKITENDREGIRNFRLFIEVNEIDGGKITQLLMKVPTFGKDELQTISLVLSTFLDADDKPDFIIRNSGNSYIFLSTFAGENEIVKPIGNSVLYSGC